MTITTNSAVSAVDWYGTARASTTACA